jgi:hypothetical protein
MADTEANKIIGSARGASGDPHEASTEEYWTEERRAAAKPVPIGEKMAARTSARKIWIRQLPAREPDAGSIYPIGSLPQPFGLCRYIVDAPIEGGYFVDTMYRL